MSIKCQLYELESIQTMCPYTKDNARGSSSLSTGVLDLYRHQPGCRAMRKHGWSESENNTRLFLTAQRHVRWHRQKATCCRPGLHVDLLWTDITAVEGGLLFFLLLLLFIIQVNESKKSFYL